MNFLIIFSLKQFINKLDMETYLIALKILNFLNQNSFKNSLTRTIKLLLMHLMNLPKLVVCENAIYI
jgi:tmRNA-binding protein